MQQSSADQVEITRKTGARLQSEVLQRLAEVTQERAADCMGVSASTISRAKEDLDKFCQMLAALGFQLAPVDAVVTNQEDLRALKRMAMQWLQADLERDLRSQTR
ncbi:CII family transcriptional regulator [Pigmentiphaga sp. CHJ604]|uniref:CII family transcriptional regulator n=1 Tax=Pigmentiphaga sp. CHJ604 TaxID=3081984 RepID=UPI0030D4E65C